MNENVIHCPDCDTPIGQRVNDKGKLYFSDGLSMMLVGYRFCPTCGKKFYWDGERQGASRDEKIARKQERMAGAW